MSEPSRRSTRTRKKPLNHREPEFDAAYDSDEYSDTGSKASAGDDAERISEEPNSSEDEPLAENEDPRPSRNLRKRARTGPKKVEKIGKGKAKVKDVGKGKRRARLSLLPEMPLDILYQIFALLPPKDLVTLTRVHTMLRDTLLSSNAITVWKAAREPCGAPDPPEDFSEAQWAKLLFGGSFCQICARRGINRIDWSLRRRVCKPCLKDNLLYEPRFGKSFPYYTKDILELIPYTHYGVSGSRSYGGTGSRFFWKADVEDIGRAYSLHTRRSAKVFDDFYNRRLAYVKSVLEYSRECQQWGEAFAIQRFQAEADAQQERLNSIKQRFIQLGYDPGDLDVLENEQTALVGARLTEAIWKRIHPKLQALVENSKAERLLTERHSLIRRRSNIVMELYAAYQKTLPPLQWLSLPLASDVCQFPEFRSILDSDADTEVTMASFTSPMSMLPDLISGWVERMRNHLTKRMGASFDAVLSTGTCSTDASSKPEPESSGHPEAEADQSISSHAEPTKDYMSLAAGVFRCTRGWFCSYNMSDTDTVAVSWDGIVQHQCRENLDPASLSEYPFTFDERTSKAAASIIRLVGLDPNEVTPDEMDGLDHRFACLGCKDAIPMGSFHYAPLGTYERRVYSWRQALCHYRRSHGYQNHPAKFRRLQTEEVSTLTMRPNIDLDLKIWSCSHCPIHFGSWQTHSDVVQHLGSIHDIIEPRTPEDVFVAPGKQSIGTGDYCALLPDLKSSGAEAEA